MNSRTRMVFGSLSLLGVVASIPWLINDSYRIREEKARALQIDLDTTIEGRSAVICSVEQDPMDLRFGVIKVATDLDLCQNANMAKSVEKGLHSGSSVALVRGNDGSDYAISGNFYMQMLVDSWVEPLRH